MTVSVQRLTLFALISAFEVDLRKIIATTLLADHSIEDLFGPQAAHQARERLKSNADLVLDDQSDNSLLDFLDIGDYIGCLHKYSKKISKGTQSFFATKGKNLENLIAIRNRVMHNRPLDFDDLPNMKSISTFAKESDSFHWGETRNLLKNMRIDSSYVLQFEDEYKVENVDKILHNLPSPDFDDTGFVGRSEQVAKLKRALSSHFPVITILGDGGLGKTSLALKVLYDSLDELSNKFDAIIWTTAKTTLLTPTEIVQIEGAIKNSLGIFQTAAAFIGSASSEAPLEIVRRWLSEFRVLLVIDNLETIMDERIREFASDIPSNSKILFTTRVGLGAYDFPVELRQLSAKEGVDYFRRVCDIYGLNELKKRDNDYIKEACLRLQWNPLAIKWFAQAVRAGGRPASILADPKLVLKFCVENVITGLSSDARGTLNVLAVTSKSQTISALHFILEMDTIRINDALRLLRAANLVYVSPSQSIVGDDSFQITPMANLYIRNYFAPPAEIQTKIRKKQEQLLAARNNSHRLNEGINVYNQNYISIRSEYLSSDTIVAEYLKSALVCLRLKEYDKADVAIERAKDMSPNYFEVYRVEAFAAWHSKQNALKAESAYERAISLKPDYAPLRRWFGGFFLRIDDMLRAREQLQEAVLLDPDRAIIKMELARANTRLKYFEEARRLLAEMDVEQFNRRELKQSIESWFQLFLAEIEELLSSESLDGAARTIGDLAKYIEMLDLTLVDTKHSISMARIVRALRRFNSDERGGERGEVALEVVKQLEDIQNGFLIGNLDVNIKRTYINKSNNTKENQRKGVIKNVISEKGFGFITDDGGKDWFFHKSHMADQVDFYLAKKGGAVIFEVGTNEKGPCAKDVKFI